LGIRKHLTGRRCLTASKKVASRFNGWDRVRCPIPLACRQVRNMLLCRVPDGTRVLRGFFALPANELAGYLLRCLRHPGDAACRVSTGAFHDNRDNTDNGETPTWRFLGIGCLSGRKSKKKKNACCVFHVVSVVCVVVKKKKGKTRVAFSLLYRLSLLFLWEET